MRYLLPPAALPLAATVAPRLLQKPYPANGCPGRVARLTDALHEERSLIGQADRRARAHLPESLSEHFGGEVVASPYLPPIV